MRNPKKHFGDLVAAFRVHKHMSQDEFVKTVTGINRSNLAHLEQGLRVPKPELLEKICKALDMPEPLWKQFCDESVVARYELEECLTDLSGIEVSLDGLDATSIASAERARVTLFYRNKPPTEPQAYDLLNSLLVYYGVRPMTKKFFDQYFNIAAFASIEKFQIAVNNYHGDAIRLYSTLDAAYLDLNHDENLSLKLAPLQRKDISEYSQRADWALPHDIPDKQLPYLGYISAAIVKGQQSEREQLHKFLTALADAMGKQGAAAAIAEVPEKTKRRMDAYLRKFKTSIEHGLFSTLWAPTIEEVKREALRLAPKSDLEIETMEKTQAQALENLAYYLSSDFLDIYVATSMRTDADFVSVNSFVKRLFAHDTVRPLSLRYFNPTQSWIDDRIAKGLVEALMLRRAQVTIYMAQKSDTFGKDSEASVALGQGKPVIVYVPRLTFPDKVTESESLFLKPRADLLALLTPADQEDIDDSADEQAIFAKLLTTRLMQLSSQDLAQIANVHWSDFDLFEEDKRIVNEADRPLYLKWLNQAVNEEEVCDISLIKTQIVGIFVANAITFERRARMFREIHPLALQVILSTGVLNGILVVRTVEQCASILVNLITNELDLQLDKQDLNYRLVEKKTGSTIRVVSRHRLLQNAFSAHYSRTRSENK